MGWLAIYDPEHAGASAQRALLTNRFDSDPLLVRGSLVIETRVPANDKPQPLVRYQGDGAWPLRLSLASVPGGGLTLVLDQGGEVVHRTINHSDAGRMDVLRFTFSWDAPRRWGQLALERNDTEHVLIERTGAPQPMRIGDALALARPGPDHFVAPEVQFLALSTEIEPVGPMPSLMPETPVATPTGYRPISDLSGGDLVVTPCGAAVPVRQVVRRTVPACGSFRPVRLRAPYFDLRQDITVAPSQRLVLSGSEVEYLFGCEAVLASARHLARGPAFAPVATEPLVTYYQLLLPRHDALIVSGAIAESLYIGRLRRKKGPLAASILANCDTRALPDHRCPSYRVLQAFDAVVLSEQRAA